MTTHDSAQQLVELGLGFWRSKVMLTGVELGLFTLLADQALPSSEIAANLRLDGRGLDDLLDALVSLALLSREADCYRDSESAARYLNAASPSYIGGLFEMADARLYPIWAHLGEALRTGLPQNEAKGVPDYYANLMADPERLRTFLRGMTGLSLSAANALAAKFEWQRYQSFADIGGAQGALSISLARQHSHLAGVVFDLPPVGPFFDEAVAAAGFAGRLQYAPGDFFASDLPEADVLIMGHVLHNWSLEQKHVLLRKAFRALRPGGALVVYEALIDDARCTNTFGLLMSLNMLLVTKAGSVFTGADCQGWMRDVGFTSTRVEHLHGPDSMVVGYKAAPE